MDSADFLVEIAKARVLLEPAAGYVAVGGPGHELGGGATSSCASQVPWQMQVKCSRCSGIFWFDNLAWRTGGTDRWKLSPDSRDHATAGCAAAGIMAGQILEATKRRSLLQPVRG